MKATLFTVLFFLITSSVLGQVIKHPISIEDKEFDAYFQNKENIPVVRGKILNLPQEIIEKATIEYTVVTPFQQFQIHKSCTLSSDGSFELILDYAFPYQQIWIKVGPIFYAGIYANTDLYIELDANILRSQNGVKYNGPGIKYLGQDGELNTYLNNHVLFKRVQQLEISKSLSLLKRSKEKDYDAFISKLDSLYALQNDLDNEFEKQNPSPFAWIIKNERQSDYYTKICVELDGMEVPTELSDKVKAHKSYLTSNSGVIFYTSLVNYLLSSNKKTEFDVESYRNYSKLGEHNKLIIDSIMRMRKNILQNQPYDTAKYLFLNNQAYIFLQDTLIVSKTLHDIKSLDKQFLRNKSDLLKMKLSSNDPNQQKLIAETLLANIQTRWCKNIIQNEYEKSVEKTASINKILQNSKTLVSENRLGEAIIETSFGAKLYKVDTVNAETLLSNLKKTFENKALIMEFWATWCAPCIQEIPHSKKLYENVQDLPVEFIYLCTSRSSDIEKWKSKIVEFKIAGIHLFVEESIEYDLMKLLSLSGFPSYMLITTKGEAKLGAISSMSQLDREKLSELIK